VIILEAQEMLQVAENEKKVSDSFRGMILVSAKSDAIVERL
jgi:hypothetical protein